MSIDVNVKAKTNEGMGFVGRRERDWRPWPSVVSASPPRKKMTTQEIRFHNTLTGKEDLFVPLETGLVKMYVCGITPYDECHLGHARCYVTFDFIRRALKRLGYRVTCVQNFTDIDDKIIQRAAEKGERPPPWPNATSPTISKKWTV
jgi:hypothetical protein